MRKKLAKDHRVETQKALKAVLENIETKETLT